MLDEISNGPGSVPVLVHHRALLDPRHHGAQLLADLLDRVRGALGAHGLERGLVDPVLQHPVLHELAGLDVVEDPLHLGARLVGDHARPRHVLAVLGGVRHRVVHGRDAALVDQVDDQLHLVHALEIGHLGRVAGLDQGLEAGLHQLDHAAAQHRLLAEQIGLALLAEARLDDAGAPAADRRTVGEREIMGIAGDVLVHRHQHRHAGAALVFRAYGMAGALGRDHHHVKVRPRLNKIEMDVEAMGEHQRGAVLHVGMQMVAVDLGLQLVGREHHHHVRPLGGLGHLHDLELLALGLLDALGTLAQRDRHVLDAGIAQVERMGMALAAVADDDDLLALDQVDVRVAIIIDTHVPRSSL